MLRPVLPACEHHAGDPGFHVQLRPVAVSTANATRRIFTSPKNLAGRTARVPNKSSEETRIAESGWVGAARSPSDSLLLLRITCKQANYAHQTVNYELFTFFMIKL